MTVIYISTLYLYLYDETKPISLDGLPWSSGEKYYKMIRFAKHYHATIMSVRDIEENYHIEYDEDIKMVIRRLAVKIAFQRELDDIL